MATVKLGKPDWDYWVTQTYWNSEQAAALFTGIDPDSFTNIHWIDDAWGDRPTIERVLRKKLPTDPIAKQFFQIRDSLRRDSAESEYRLLRKNNTPAQYLEWAKEKRIRVPQRLVDAVAKQKHHKREGKPLTGEYSTLYLTLMHQAIISLNITDSNQPPKENLEDWFKQQDSSLSDRAVSAMATLVRLPEMQKGGHWRADKTKGDTKKSKRQPREN